ncbi:unnamed protein product [Zymoseptoria tritici ST99CH_1A5]|uniref:Uncharacterized protein n=1 Tax=Zymoseptoria tritici ST99CH_1A5 TaxID=1276529 RepID=A0A1Y6LIG2_ZYMTR|nr:unnamed protein product [Zymoseptoria tritici ST99CH_1A5]
MDVGLSLSPFRRSGLRFCDEGIGNWTGGMMWKREKCRSLRTRSSEDDGDGKTKAMSERTGVGLSSARADQLLPFALPALTRAVFNSDISSPPQHSYRQAPSMAHSASASAANAYVPSSWPPVEMPQDVEGGSL